MDALAPCLDARRARTFNATLRGSVFYLGDAIARGYTRLGRMRDVLFISKPIAPPWTDSNKNLVRDLARGLTRYRARVMVPRGTSFNGAVSEPVYQSLGAYAPSRAANARVLARLLTGPRADVWHFFFAPNPLTLRAGRVASLLRRTPTVHTIASAPDSLEAVAPQLFADRVVVLSEHTAARLARVGVTATVIPPALGDVSVAPDAITRARERYKLPERYVLYPGDLEHSDGARTFVRAAARPEVRGFGWVVAARPKTPAARDALASLTDEARALGAPVTWLGELDDILAVVAGASAIVLVTDTLHAKMDWPLVLLEALALGVPVLVGDRTAAAELVRSGGAVALAAGDDRSVANECQRLVDDPAAAKWMAEEGGRWVRATCSPSVIAARYEALYDVLAR
jgi:phosphatidylinositol alpha-1,6-mannosyltransferase